MKLHIIGSNSDGNSYLLEASTGDTLMIECGVRFKYLQQALSFNYRKVAGCLVTHSHGDHCKAANDVLKVGIPVYATQGEHEAMKTEKHHNAMFIKAGSPAFMVGAFRVMAFSTEHDTPDPVGYLINHSECGTVLFLTDTVYSKSTFQGLNNIIVEANYCENILQRNLESGTNKVYGDRVIQSHMSIQNTLELLRSNDISHVNNIVLIHLSNGNSNAEDFKRRVKDLTGKTVHIADKGMIIPFDKTPF